MTARWARKDCFSRWGTFPRPAGCRYCGSCRMGDVDCPACTCKACGSVQCNSYGGSRGQCGVCLVGITDSWSGHDRPCGYKGCKERAVATAPRVRNACAEHVKRAAWRAPRNKEGQTVLDYVRARIEERDRNWILVDLGDRR